MDWIAGNSLYKSSCIVIDGYSSRVIGHIKKSDYYVTFNNISVMSC